MPFETLSAGRGPLFVCLTASVLALGLAGCGRRGPLEPPPDAAAAPARQVAARPVPASPATLPQQGTLDTPDDETDEQEQVVQNVVPTPAAPGSRKRSRGYTIPKEPFILDPLL